MHRRLSGYLCVAATAGLLIASAGRAQVDWSDLFPDEGKPAAKAAARPAPPPRAAVPPPAAAPRPATKAAPRASEEPLQRPSRVAKPQPPAPAPSRRAAIRKPQRKVAKSSPPPGPRGFDREFPAVAEVAPPKFDRHSSLRSSPPPSTLDEQRAPAAVAVPEPVPAKAEMLPEKADAAPQPPSAPVAANKVENKIEQSSVHERVQLPEPKPVAEPKSVAEPEPVAEPKPVAEPEAAVPAAAADRVVKAAPAPREAKSDVAPKSAPPAPAVASRAAKVAAAADDGKGSGAAPLQVAAAPAEAALITNYDHNGTHAIIDSDGTGMPAGLHPGDVVSEQNMAKYSEFLSPGLEWAIRYGLRIKVIAPRHIELPRVYREATEKYAGQVKLSPDGGRVLNYTAGQPFPRIDPNDPQVALKIMWNYSYSGYITDDLNAENFDADTGSLGKNRGMTVERHYLIDNLRRLVYTGRLHVDPKPALPNPDDLRYKESLHPLSEPFDLKGVGATFYRYNDVSRQDDSWLYLPQLRRVRRLSSAQRSDALFGQDSDADSYYGYNGQIGWAQWKFLGERTVLGVMHAEHRPVKWQDPEDWIFDDVWEPRRVYAVEGMSNLPQYAYGKRVIFIDKESGVVTHSDIYDRAGQLWKVWLNDHTVRKESIPGALLSRYPDEMAFTNAIVMLDTQLVHGTRAALPSTHTPDKECTFYNLGDKSGTKEDFFTVANLIEMGH